jgi:hypothetical protein
MNPLTVQIASSIVMILAAAWTVFIMVKVTRR